MPRKEFPTKVRVAAFQRAQGRCEACTAKLASGNVEFDHRIPAAFDGPPTLDNCVVLCKSCHKAKTGQKDVPAIAKSNRVRAKTIGAKAPSRNPIAGSKASGWRRKLNGDWERR